MEEDSLSSESELEIHEPWHRVSDPCFVRELRREVCPQHVLYGVQVKTVARRYDNDDVLFELSDHTHSLVGPPPPLFNNSFFFNVRKGYGASHLGRRTRN
jgi:hypothetical protein